MKEAKSIESINLARWRLSKSCAPGSPNGNRTRLAPQRRGKQTAALRGLRPRVRTVGSPNGNRTRLAPQRRGKQTAALRGLRPRVRTVGSPNGNRTRALALRGLRPNRETMGP